MAAAERKEPREPSKETVAVVLAGGRARRLHPISTVIPKPLMPVGEVAVLEILMRQLARHGFTEVVLSLGYLGELIRAFVYAHAGDFEGVRPTFVEEREPLGTAGPLSLLPDDGRTVLLLNGDILTDLDFRALVKAHDKGNAALTVAITERRIQLPFGALTLDEDTDRVVAVQEKPELVFLASMGAYVIGPEARRRVPSDRRMDMPELIEILVRAGEAVSGFRWAGKWLDIGSPTDLEQAEPLAHSLLETLGEG